MTHSLSAPLTAGIAADEHRANLAAEQRDRLWARVSAPPCKHGTEGPGCALCAQEAIDRCRARELLADEINGLKARAETLEAKLAEAEKKRDDYAEGVKHMTDNWLWEQERADKAEAALKETREALTRSALQLNENGDVACSFCAGRATDLLRETFEHMPGCIVIRPSPGDTPT